MQEGYMRFGDYIRGFRLRDPRELSMKDVAEFLDISPGYISDVENLRKKPFGGKMLEQLAEFYGMTEEQKARMYDLASLEGKNETPLDITDTLMRGNVGDMARFALRQSKAGIVTEADWKTFIRKIEDRKAKMERAQATRTKEGDGDG